jgi:hypothetical protein
VNLKAAIDPYIGKAHMIRKCLFCGFQAAMGFFAARRITPRTQKRNPLVGVG